jgi:MATE family, multidrug efflux pump
VLQVRGTSFSFIGVLVLLVSNSMFRATGRAMPGLIMNVIRMGVIIVPLAYLAIFVFKSAIINHFIIIVLANLLAMVMSYGWSTHYLKKLVFRQVE